MTHAINKVVAPLFIAWVAVFFCIHKGIKSSGKVNKKKNSLKKINLKLTCY